MTKVLNIQNGIAEENLREIISILNNGGVILYPTDTQYGLGAIATDNIALDKIREIKNRDKSKAISIIVSDTDMALKYVSIPNTAQDLINKHLPGALTLILPARDTELSENLGNNLKIGIRIPDQQDILNLVKQLNMPITTTSANISGQIPAYTVDEIMLQFGESADLIDMILDNGILDENASTIVEINENEVIVLREGGVKIY